MSLRTVFEDFYYYLFLFQKFIKMQPTAAGQSGRDAWGSVHTASVAHQRLHENCLQMVQKKQWPIKTRNSAIADKPARRDYRSFKVTKHSTIPYVRYSFLLYNRNFVFKTCRFYDIRLQKCRDLENRIRGPSRSLEMSICDRARVNSYWRSIVTMALSRVVSVIFNVEKCRDLEMGQVAVVSTPLTTSRG